MTRIRRLGKDTFSSLRNRNYRLYFVGQIISVSGTWMQRFAQAWLILGLTNNSGVALGVEAGLQFLPMLLFGAWGGVIADRFDKRRLLYATQAASAVLAFGLGSLVAFGTPTVALVYMFSVLLGFVNVFDNPARQTFVMEMVGREELPNAVALNSVVINSSRVVGPAVGGLVVATIGLAPCFFLNAASFVAVIVALAMMRADALLPAPIVPRAKGQLRDGFRYVWSDRRVRTPLLMMAVIGTLAFNFSVITPLIAVKTFGLGAGGLGVLTAVMGLGAVLGGLAMASRHGVSARRLVGLGFAMGVAIFAAGAAPTLVAEFAGQFAMGFMAFAFVATANTTLQLTSRPEMRGRVMALYAIAFLGSTPIGGPIIGWVCAQWGPRAGFYVGGIAAILASATAGWSYLRVRGQRLAQAPLSAEDAGVAERVTAGLRIHA
jgi:MFS family permease